LQLHILRADHFADSRDTLKKKFNCPYCGLAFDRITPLSGHIKENHPKKAFRTYLPCFWCKRIYFSMREYQQVFDSFCAKRKLEYDCKMRLEEGLLQHFGEHCVIIHYLHFYLTATSFDCQMCDEKFYIEEDLLCHSISFHSKIQERIFCNDCNEHFANQYEVRRHRIEAHPAITEPPTRFKKRKQCEECGLCYNSSRKLALHIMDQ
jgi:hypothetical protein